MEPTWTPSLEIELRVFFADLGADDGPRSNFRPMLEAIVRFPLDEVDSDAAAAARIDARRARERVYRTLQALTDVHKAALEAAFGGDYEGLNEQDRTEHGDELAAVMALHPSVDRARVAAFAQAHLDTAKQAYARIREVE